MPQPPRVESVTSPRRLDAAEKHRQALELRKAGADFRSIAAQLGYASVASAHRAVTAALRRAVIEPAAEVIALETARLDRLLMAVWPACLTGDLAAIDRALAISKRRAALLGLDAPIKREITGTLVLRDFASRAAEAAGLDPALVLAEAERILDEALH
jgi:hypothetical protein